MSRFFFCFFPSFSFKQAINSPKEVEGMHICPEDWRVT